MACESMLKPNQNLQDRQREVQAALDRLKGYLRNGSVKVTIGANGAVIFNGWNDRDGLNDACTYRSLTLDGSWELRQAVATAERISGRKVNPKAVGSGLHSHDNGKTWVKH